MKALPDKCVDCVITDPPYGLGNRLSDGGGKLKNTPMSVLYRTGDWVDVVPKKEVFDSIFRVSKNQIICGGNYFNLPPTRCIIAWDKTNYLHTLSDWEYIWTSFDSPAKMYRRRSLDLNRKHPTQKPVALMKWIIDKYTTPDAIILDPFSGSGTTGVACIETGRNFLGFEIDPRWCDLANKRIEAAKAQTTLAL